MDCKWIANGNVRSLDRRAHDGGRQVGGRALGLRRLRALLAAHVLHCQRIVAADGIERARLGRGVDNARGEAPRRQASRVGLAADRDLRAADRRGRRAGLRQRVRGVRARREEGSEQRDGLDHLLAGLTEGGIASAATFPMRPTPATRTIQNEQHTARLSVRLRGDSCGQASPPTLILSVNVAIAEL